MLTRLALAALAALLLLPAAAGAQPPADGGTDAIWVWSWDDPGTLASDLTTDGFDRAYLYAEGGFGPKVRNAIAALDAEGVAVEVLGGEKRWATDHRDGMLDFVRSARRYQRDAPPDARIAGIHVDVEPYGLKAWDRDERGVARSLLRSLTAARRAAGPLPFAADIPFWFDDVSLGGGHGQLAKAVIGATDATTIMAYRDSGPAIIDVARQEIRMAMAAGRATTVGVETGRVSPEQVTFAEEGMAAMVDALAAVRAAFGPNPGFGGIAVHHYGSLSELGP